MEWKQLSHGGRIPSIGLGVFRSGAGEETENAVRWALEAGYRHLDTAMIYGNEESVGNAMRQSGIPREEIFLTTKLWNDDIRAENTKAALQASLDRLQTDYLDLYLIHWPTEKRELAWAEMENALGTGAVRAIGVSNFQIHHLEELDRTLKIVPAVNQIESNPYFQNTELINYCQERGIAVEVWSPLGGSKTAHIREDETIAEIAKRYGRSAAQVIIRWQLQRGTIVLPKSVHKERIAQNLEVFDFTLSEADMARMAALERGTRTGSDPDTFTF